MNARDWYGLFLRCVLTLLLGNGMLCISYALIGPTAFKSGADTAIPAYSYLYSGLFWTAVTFAGLRYAEGLIGFTYRKGSGSDATPSALTNR